MSVKYSNLPGVFSELIDQGQSILPFFSGPRTLVLGTASSGFARNPYVVIKSSTAASEFGSGGTLTRGLYEVAGGGASNVILYRIGSTPAILDRVGNTAGTEGEGYRIETYRRDDDAGAMYGVYYNDGEDRLIIWNLNSGSVVFDNSSTDPIDVGEVYVSGSRAAGGGGNIGTGSSGVALEDVSVAGTFYTAGQDNSSPSRMELFQFLYQAYKDLEVEEFDWVVPMDTYLDDPNVIDGDAFSATYLGTIIDGAGFPEPKGNDDILGKVFVEEYLGQFYFFWDLDGDGTAELYPNGVGSCTDGTTKIDGTGLSSADFHEANFAYQLARFCYSVTTNNRMCHGFVGVHRPASATLADMTGWVGKLPNYSQLSDGTRYIASAGDDGTGLLGNKFMAGKYGYRNGVANGGFILTDTEWIDGATELTDSNGEVIDIGRHLSVIASYIRLFNAADRSGRGYIATMAPTYAGFVSRLDAKVAPTNKRVPAGMHALGHVNIRKVNDLVGCGYVYAMPKPRGFTIVDAPTAARPTSDYRRLTTVKIVKAIVDDIRRVADPFVGNAFAPLQRSSLETAVREVLIDRVGRGYITRWDPPQLTQTPSQAILAIADLQVNIVPAWELRQINLTISLSPA